MANSGKTLLVVPSTLGGPEPKGGKGLFSEGPRAVHLDANALKGNLKDFLETINEMVSSIPKVTGPFQLNEIELTVEVNGEGSIQLIGGMKVGATGGITLRLKR